ncbi:glycine-rich cell wall structural protein 1.0-like [Panicum virgatum]|uniref:Uncharacterized protein n=1 Tax=Panicum virgatum TaxID=38727 RepID=A0A8T0UQ23_PANVG|nr:glycine-rich cell wall structural protein 1.0-like [Panicum virgatum]KAG2622419.1 hypothetical protein PVAP13_3NG265902 [Panicum virgatum]
MAPHRRCARTLLLLVAAAVASAARDLDAANPLPAPAAGNKPDPAYHGGYGGAIPGIPPGGFYGAGPGNNGGGGGWGAGYGGPGGGGGYAHGGVEVPTVVCQEKGPCYGKKVACPKRCFWSYSRSGNGYGAGGGGGSCAVDCKAKCTATC